MSTRISKTLRRSMSLTTLQLIQNTSLVVRRRTKTSSITNRVLMLITHLELKELLLLLEGQGMNLDL